MASKTLHRALLLLTVSAALVLPWNQPLLSSHAFRQTQTAEMAQLFLLEGWTPLLTHIRFIADPGVAVLELPIYQSLMAGLARWPGLPLENAGRLLSWLSAIALALAGAAASRRLNRFLGEPQEAWPRSVAFLLLFASPLVFATSQWVTIELLVAALAAWGFICFDLLLEAKGLRQMLVWTAAFGLLAGSSLLMKPHGVFAIAPLFIWRYAQTAPSECLDARAKKALLLKTGLALLATFLAVGLAAAWYSYGERMNLAFHSPFSVSATRAHLMFGEKKIWQLPVLARYAARFGLYVLGPGTIVLLALSALRSAKPARKQVVFALVCALSIFLYLSVFTGANYFHKYYQSVAVFPLYLALFALLRWRPGRWGTVVLACAVVANAAVGVRSLTRQDPHWIALVDYLKGEIPRGYEQPVIHVLTNSGTSLPILSYSLQRRTLETPREKLPDLLQANAAWLGVCDEREGPECRTELTAAAPVRSTPFGPLTLLTSNPGVKAPTSQPKIKR